MKTQITALLFCLIAALPLHAEDKASPEVRLREAIRNLTLQLRSVQAERDKAVSAQAEADQQKQALELQVKTLTAHSAEDKATIDSLQGKLAERDQHVSALEQELGKWKTACNHAAEVAKNREIERAKLADRIIVLDRTVADQRAKNAGMFKIGTEVLSRYEKFGLGTAITAREPFVGTTRVKLENLVQDYSDKLNEQRIKP